MRGRWMAGAVGIALAMAVSGYAQDATFPPGGIAEALKARVGKQVTLHLASGTQLGGTIAEVRDQAVVVKGITGRDLLDALVRLDQVAAIEVRR